MATASRAITVADLLLGEAYGEQRARLISERALERERRRIQLCGLGIVFENRDMVVGILEELAWKEQLAGDAVLAYLELLNPVLETADVLASVFAHAAALGQLSPAPGAITLSLEGAVYQATELSLAAAGESGLSLLYWSFDRSATSLSSSVDLLVALGNEVVAVPSVVAAEVRQLIAG